MKQTAHWPMPATLFTALVMARQLQQKSQPIMTKNGCWWRGNMSSLFLCRYVCLKYSCFFVKGTCNVRPSVLPTSSNERCWSRLESAKQFCNVPGTKACSDAPIHLTIQMWLWLDVVKNCYHLHTYCFPLISLWCAQAVWPDLAIFWTLGNF